MGFLQSLRDKYLVAPVAKRITDSIAKAKTNTVPSIFSVPVGFNNAMASYNKRVTSNSIDWTTLRSLSINHETTRAAINARKRQITQLGYDVVDVDDDVDPLNTERERQEVRDLLTSLGGKNIRFRTLLNRLIEDTLVLDALCFYKQRDRGGRLISIIPIDAATIKLRVDQSGARPTPPDVAFEQWIKGAKVAEMTTEDMTYEMMNPRNDSPYGLSPLESLIVTLDSSMRAMLYNLNYLSDNNVPQGWLAMPEGWTPDQIKEYKEWLDAIIGSSKAQAKIYPIPAGTTYQATSKPSDFSFQEMFDYLDRKIAMMFDLTPQELGMTLKQYKENAEGQDKIQTRKGIKPLANFLQEIFTDIIQEEFGYQHFAFKFTGLDGKYTSEDLKALIPIGVLSVDEARNDKGLSKLGIDNFIITGVGATPLSQIQATVSGTQNETVEIEQEEETDNDPSSESNDSTSGEKTTVDSVEDLTKKGRNLSFEAVEKDPQFRKFKTAIRKGLIEAIMPYTNPDMISSTQKADLPNTTVKVKINGLDDYLAWAFTQGKKNANKALNINSSFDIRSQGFADMIANRSNYLIDSVNDTTKDWLVSQISAGHDASLTNAQIAQKISDDLPDITQARANTIVNTEVANAMQEAELQTYKDQGIEEKTWITSEDELVCPICEPLDGEIEKVDDNFSSGDAHPPAHPNCRCYEQAVLEKVDVIQMAKDWVTINGAHVLIGGAEGSSGGSTGGKTIGQIQEEHQRASGQGFLADYDKAINSKDWEAAARIAQQVMSAPKGSMMQRYASGIVPHFAQYVAPILEGGSPQHMANLSALVPLLSGQLPK